MRISDEMLATVYDGLCTVYINEPRLTDSGWEAAGEYRELYREVPCHLSFEQAGNIAAKTPGEVLARGKVFLGAKYEIPPGSELSVKQCGREYRLGLSGLPRVYAVHQEIAVALAEELA